MLTGAQAVVEAGAIGASEPRDEKAFRWHLCLWDPWFLVWGLLLGAATRGAGRLGRPVR
ncbi:hypothetical protein [Streptomyces buecherae]|uniref:hypothetical protein n=1 Tax=Streptomyces buecherae TaxID=2763006 RepID=UPI0036CABD62